MVYSSCEVIIGTIRKKAAGRNTERMSDTSFRMMTFIFMVMDFFFPYIKKRVRGFHGVAENSKSFYVTRWVMKFGQKKMTKKLQKCVVKFVK